MELRYDPRFVASSLDGEHIVYIKGLLTTALLMGALLTGCGGPPQAEQSTAVLASTAGEQPTEETTAATSTSAAPAETVTAATATLEPVITPTMEVETTEA